jgi:SAM-dependent methyltransferase
VDEQYRDASNLNARIALHERFSTNPCPLPRWLFDQFELPPDARILEIGCGTGKLWTDNLGRIPAGWSITLTDASPSMLRETEENLGATRRFWFRVADAREVPFEDGAFDAAISNHVLHHIPERQRAISEMARVLGEYGTLYAATGGRRHLHEMDRMMRFLDPAHPDDGLAQLIEAFSLENGAEQLSSRFHDVSLRRYEDGLVVTEARPLVDYVLSTASVREALADLCEEELLARVRRLAGYLEQELNDHGGIRITKETGLFVARR